MKTSSNGLTSVRTWERVPVASLLCKQENRFQRTNWYAYMRTGSSGCTDWSLEHAHVIILHSRTRTGSPAASRRSATMCTAGGSSSASMRTTVGTQTMYKQCTIDHVHSKGSKFCIYIWRRYIYYSCVILYVFSSVHLQYNQHFWSLKFCVSFKLCFFW